jgi:hypothetical protein
MLPPGWTVPAMSHNLHRALADERIAHMVATAAERRERRRPDGPRKRWARRPAPRPVTSGPLVLTDATARQDGPRRG